MKCFSLSLAALLAALALQAPPAQAADTVEILVPATPTSHPTYEGSYQFTLHDQLSPYLHHEYDVLDNNHDVTAQTEFKDGNQTVVGTNTVTSQINWTGDQTSVLSYSFNHVQVSNFDHPYDQHPSILSRLMQKVDFSNDTGVNSNWSWSVTGILEGALEPTSGSEMVATEILDIFDHPRWLNQTGDSMDVFELGVPLTQDMDTTEQFVNFQQQINFDGQGKATSASVFFVNVYATPVGFTPAAGDVNGDGLMDAHDIMLVGQAKDMAYDARADIDGDQDVDQADQDLLVFGPSYLNTRPGDANLDGKVDLVDLNTIGANFGKYGGWQQGDFNGDFQIDLLDHNLFGLYFGYDNSAAPAAPAVPEPASLSLLLVGAVALIRRRA